MEVIELFSATKVKDDFGYFTTTQVSQGNYPANVEVASGSKALYYQRLGISHAVTIELRAVSFLISKIVWKGHEVVINSIVDVENKGRFLEILGDYKEDVNITSVTTIAPTTTIAP